MSTKEFYIIIGGMGIVAAYFIYSGATKAAGSVSNAINSAPGAAYQAGQNLANGAASATGLPAVWDGITSGAEDAIDMYSSNFN
jgi:hypothetical protein